MGAPVGQWRRHAAGPAAGEHQRGGRSGRHHGPPAPVGAGTIIAKPGIAACDAVAERQLELAIKADSGRPRMGLRAHSLKRLTTGIARLDRYRCPYGIGFPLLFKRLELTACWPLARRCSTWAIRPQASMKSCAARCRWRSEE